MQKPKISPFKNKLVILYLLKASTKGLSELQIIRILQELDIMMYFDMKQYLYELEKESLIESINSINGIKYKISKQGSDTLSEFVQETDISVRNKINAYLDENKQALMNESQYSAEYLKIDDHQYKIILRIFENEGIMFEINFILPDVNAAQNAVKSWDSNAIEIYKNTIGSLLFKNEESNIRDNR